MRSGSAALIAEQFPECYLGHMPVFLSHEISPKAGEYRRSMTVIIDAYLRDLTEGHLLRLSDDLRGIGYRRPVFVAKNTGGLSSLSRSQALHLLGSSPAASVIGSDRLGELVGAPNVIVSDMGGTSFDVGLVVEGRDRVYEYDPVVDRFRVQTPLCRALVGRRRRRVDRQAGRRASSASGRTARAPIPAPPATAAAARSRR